MPTSDTSTQAQAEATAADPAEALSSCNADVDFKGQKRTNATHASTTDAEARIGFRFTFTMAG